MITEAIEVGELIIAGLILWLTAMVITVGFTIAGLVWLVRQACHTLTSACAATRALHTTWEPR